MFVRYAYFDGIAVNNPSERRVGGNLKPYYHIQCVISPKGNNHARDGPQVLLLRWIKRRDLPKLTAFFCGRLWNWCRVSHCRN